MSDTPPCASPLVNDRLAQINAATNGTLSFGMFATVGRSLVAGRNIGCGEVVLQDTPIVTFPIDTDTDTVVHYSDNTTAEDWSSKLSECCTSAHRFLAGESSSVSPPKAVKPATTTTHLQATTRTIWPLVEAALLVSSPRHFPSTSTIIQDGKEVKASLEAARGTALLDMHIPDPTIAEVTRLYQYCESIVGASESDVNKDEAVTALLHAVMAAKVNSHRSADGTHWCLYPVASNLAHSCDPNMFYIPTMSSVPANNDNGTDRIYAAKFVATHDIAAGELLSFSYLPMDLLVAPAEPRQARLAASHRFVCACSRCSSMDTFTSEIIDVTSTLGLSLLEPLGLQIRKSRSSITNGGAYLVRRTSKHLQSDDDINIKSSIIQPKGKRIQSTKSTGAWCLVGLEFPQHIVHISDEHLSKALNETSISTSISSPLLSTTKMTTIGDLMKQAEGVVGGVRELVGVDGGDSVIDHYYSNEDDKMASAFNACSKILELIPALGDLKTLLTDSIGSRHYLVSHIVDCQCKLSLLGGNILRCATVSTNTTVDTSSEHLARVYAAIVALLDDDDEEKEGDGEVSVTTCKELLVRLHGRYTMHYIVWTSLTADMGGAVLASARKLGSDTQMFPTHIKYEQDISENPEPVPSDTDASFTIPDNMTESRCACFPHPIVTKALQTWCDNVFSMAIPKLKTIVFEDAAATTTTTSDGGTPSKQHPACIIHMLLTEGGVFESEGGGRVYVREETSLPPFLHDYNVTFINGGTTHELMGFTFPTQGPAAEVPTLFPNHKDLYNLVMACMVGNLIVAPSLRALSGGVGDVVDLNGFHGFIDALAFVTKCLLGGGDNGALIGKSLDFTPLDLHAAAAPTSSSSLPTTRLSPEVLQTLVPDYTINYDYYILSEILDASQARNALFWFQPFCKKFPLKIDIRITEKMLLSSTEKKEKSAQQRASHRLESHRLEADSDLVFM